ncbi:copper amine oxidase [Lineolata rhizophorae]|uniref:Amine oxidase n=1 Tax=Lineolata rhizophorae TaxID=578093 RepID=A0A6A6P0G2_9PEZI|nr:copper amine oxidase [Lineolata rhizophorae]
MHPLSPLSADEIAAASALVRSLWPAGTDLQFKVIMLEEPEKSDVLPYLDAEHAQQSLPKIDRRAWVNYYIRNTSKFHEAIINLSRQTIERHVRLGLNQHGNGDAEEIVAVEQAALKDESVLAEVAKLKIPEGSVLVIDPWIYGSDGVNDDNRMYQCFIYMRDPMNPQEADSNHYALPLPISPAVSTEGFKVVRIDILPTGADNTIKPLEEYSIKPPNEYLPEYQKLRSDLMPLHISQPLGASFWVTRQGTSTVIQWQKWSFRVGFNQREGPVLYDVRYDERPLFYRLSLSDMSIPYADPRHPYHKKQAFDLGDAGAGLMTNNLKLGCDCLGMIQYLDGVITSDKGDPTPMENVICIHEQDNGIGWKHTNFRTGRAALVRNRELVLQSIITVANYEYIMAFMFNQAGELNYEVRATGILSTQPIDDGVDVDFGTRVHPGVLAVHHQHIFSLRVDPMLDGPANRLVYEEAHAMPRSDFNPHGIGYTTKETVVERAAGLDLDPDANRIFKIQNAGVRNPVNGKPVAYKIHAPPFQKILADKDSFHFRRAEFADHNVYVVPYKPHQLFAAGQYTNQSRGGTGVRAWASGQEPVVDTDIVLFVQFGINHVPRIEDFPVMPVEILKLAMKPVNFFDRNPALDVPPSEQSFNKSSLASEAHKQPSQEAEVGEGGAVCCSSTSKL